VRERIHDVEAAAEINRELFEWFPFILQIESVEVAVRCRSIDDAQGTSLVWLPLASTGKTSVTFRRWHAAVIRNAAERVLIVEFVARVQRDSIRENVAINAEATPLKMRSPRYQAETGRNYKG
jgi:hypothetical protein